MLADKASKRISVQPLLDVDVDVEEIVKNGHRDNFV